MNVKQAPLKLSVGDSQQRIGLDRNHTEATFELVGGIVTIVEADIEDQPP